MAWELLPSPSRPPRAHAPPHTLHPGPPLTHGPARMEAPSPPDSESRNRVSVGTLDNRLVRVGSNRTRQPGPVTQVGWSPAARQVNIRRYAPSRAGSTPPRLRRVLRSPPGPAPLIHLGFISHSWAGPLVSRKVHPRQGSSVLRQPRSLSAAPGSTVLNRPSPLGSSSYKLGFIGHTLVRPACSK